MTLTILAGLPAVTGLTDLFPGQELSIDNGKNHHTLVCRCIFTHELRPIMTGRELIKRSGAY
jgi:hypothetical protein